MMRTTSTTSTTKRTPVPRTTDPPAGPDAGAGSTNQTTRDERPPDVSTPNDDPVIKQFRDQISDNDLKIVELLNKRLKLVDKLWRYKADHDVEVYNQEREEWMLTFISRANKGPLSGDALQDIYRHIVEVTKNEAGRLGAE